ncbi:MAG: polysaccharide deacetylase family protein [Gaiellaceae bacterium]
MRVALCLAAATLVVVPFAAASRNGPEPFKPVHRVLQWEQTRALRIALRKGEPIYCGGGNANVVALTFDDGPGPYTAQLLSMLQGAGAHATFFLIGNRVQYWPETARDEARLGAVGNHSWSHPRLTHLPRWLVWAELLRTQYTVSQSLGWKPRMFRAPYELHDAQTDSIARSLGLLQVFWSAISGDDRAHPTAKSVARNVIGDLHPGAIVLLHDIHPWTIAAMPAILAAAQARGIRLVSVPELLVLDPPGTHQHCAFAPGGD